MARKISFALTGDEKQTTKTRRNIPISEIQWISRKDVVDAAIHVHRALGPGLLESAYQACVAHDLRKRGRRIECEVVLPLEYDGVKIDAGYRLDMRVDGVVLVENKVVDALLPVHQAQLITYLKLTGLTLGFLVNWNVTLLRDGIKRVVFNHPTRPMSHHAGA